MSDNFQSELLLFVYTVLNVLNTEIRIDIHIPLYLVLKFYTKFVTIIVATFVYFLLRQ